ncbi:MAG: hypothetical protein ACI8TQ_000542 [Planctomycetota bacterium]|jgi:hypothetical protein
MKFNSRHLLNGTLTIALLCFASRADAQSQSGVSGAKPLIPPPIVTTKSPIKMVTPGLPLSPSPVLRTNLNTTIENPLTFTKVPGGIVFGLLARFANDELEQRWSDASFQRGASGWTLQSKDGSVLRLPEDESSFIAGALAFARNQAAGDWLVDIGAEGAVSLATSIQNTQAGIVAVRADLVPQFFMPIFAGGKSLIVDRDVRLSIRTDQLRFDADLELRLYRPGRNPGGEELADRVGMIPLLRTGAGTNKRPVLSSPEGASMKSIASHLDRLSALAGWIGFFRWANAAKVTGLDALEQELRLSSVSVQTPLTIAREDRVAWVTGSTALPPSEVPAWMREHRERVLAGSKQ